jgi:REP element-mobilizing transposase RayT
LTTHRIFFVTTHFAREALPLTPEERDLVLQSLAETRQRRGVLLMAYVVMPSHLHLLIAPKGEDTVSDLMRELKLTCAKRIGKTSTKRGRLWQARFFDRIIRHPKEWRETIEYIHANPVKDDLVEKPGRWPWSSWRAYRRGKRPPIPVDLVEMPLNEHAPLAW